MEKGKEAVQKGLITPEQMEEIKAGDFFTIKQIAEKLRYSVAWITLLVQQGRIKGIKPVGGQWRIPKSEYIRITTEGVPPLPRETQKAPVNVLQVPEEKAAKVAPERKESKEKGKSSFPIDFSGLFGSK